MKETTRTVDALTGEIISATIEHRQIVTPDEFMQVYLMDMASLFQISKKSDIFILLWMWKDSSYFESKDGYPGNKVVVNKQFIDTLINQAKKSNGPLTEGTIRNGITGLCNKGLITKDQKYRGTYYLNPKYFFKGKLSDRDAKMSFTKVYDIKPDINQD